MHNQQRDRVLETLKESNLSTDDKNIELIRSERVRVVKNSLPKQVRGALMKAVKDGRLCRFAKNGCDPEIFYHPNFEHLAKEERGKIRNEKIRAIAAVCGGADNFGFNP